MKKIFVALFMWNVALFASVGSSIKIPIDKHMKYTFGNHRYHPIQKVEKEQYLKSLAPLTENDIQKSLEEKGYKNMRIELKDIKSELLYEVYADLNSTQRMKLYIDPANAAILEQVIIP